MAAPDLSGLIQVGYAILATTVSKATSKILVQLGDMRGATDTDNAEWWQHIGFASRPSKAVKDKSAAQGVVVKGGDRDTCIASQDARGVELYGNLQDGETCVYAAGPDGTAQGRALFKGDGSVTLYTTADNTPDGLSVYFRVAPDGFEFVAPWGTLKFDGTGLHVLHASGASIDLGGLYNIPGFDQPPLNTLTSYVTLQAGTINSKSSAQSFGVGTPTPLAGSVAVLQAIAGLQAQIAALAAVIDAKPPGSLPLVVAAAPAIATAAESVAAATLLIPATTSST
jgi:hypothetical protein